MLFEHLPLLQKGFQIAVVTVNMLAMVKGDCDLPILKRMHDHGVMSVERDVWQLDGQCKSEELKRHCAVHAEWSSLSSLIYELLAS